MALDISLAITAETTLTQIQGVFLHWASPEKLKYGKPRLGGDSTLT